LSRQIAGGDEARFAVIPPRVFDRYQLAGKHLAGVGEVAPAIVQRCCPLLRAERY
jgi:hypothetical protein